MLRRGVRQAAKARPRKRVAAISAPVRKARTGSKESEIITVTIAKPTKPQARRMEMSAKACSFSIGASRDSVNRIPAWAEGLPSAQA